MTIEEAIKILQDYNLWRRGAEMPQPCPRQIGLALDLVLVSLEFLIKQNQP